jgi:peptidoglycan hydrolase-like protein with peptidoglycan-binding domain
MTICRSAVAAALALSVAASGARAQVTPPPRPTDSESDAPKAALLDAQKAAFLAMPETDRKAAQDALGWLGLYNGAVDGAFGKRTLESILAYQTSLKAQASGVVSTAQLAALKASAQKARAAVGFQNLDDARTGIRIGAPLKLLDKRNVMSAQTQLTNHDGAVSLDLLAPPGPKVSLAGLYVKLSAEGPDRKVTYKAMKAENFFVVAGEQGSRKFYLRYAVAPASAPDFDPVPASPEPGKPGKPVAGAPVETGNAPVAANEPVLTATALVVAPGQAVTVLLETKCKSPTIAGKPVKFIRSEASGLALLGGDFGGAATALRLGAGAGDVIVLSLTPGDGAGKSVLEVGDATLATPSETSQTIVGSLSNSAQGAPAFDRQGALAAFVAPLGAEPNRRDGVVLTEPHAAVAARAAASFANWSNAAAAADAAPMGAAEIGRRMRGAILGVFCTP